MIESKAQIGIKTLTPSYDKVEDRIRLSINYQDLSNRIDLMITRDFILKLLPSFEDFIYTYYPNQSEDITNNKQQTQISNNNQNQTNMEDLALYQSKEELLVTINFNYDQTSKLSQLSFISKENTTCLLKANDTLLNDILNSIKASIPKLSWGIGYL